jgi:hypothetical protein
MMLSSYVGPLPLKRPVSTTWTAPALGDVAQSRLEREKA